MRAKGTRVHIDRVVVLCFMPLFCHARGFVIVGVCTGGGVSEKVGLSKAYVLSRNTRCKAALRVEKVRLAVTEPERGTLAFCLAVTPLSTTAFVSSCASLVVLGILWTRVWSLY